MKRLTRERSDLLYHWIVAEIARLNAVLENTPSAECELEIEQLQSVLDENFE
jgi:hypothetical protein